MSVLDDRFGVFFHWTRTVIPEAPVFGGTPGEIMGYGGHGYVALIKPLPVGVHSLHLHGEGDIVGLPEGGFDADTTITVTG